jgi:hypothetical protein
MDEIIKEYEELSEPWLYDGDIVKAIRNEALERAAKIAESYHTIEGRAIAEDIRRFM